MSDAKPVSYRHICAVAGRQGGFIHRSQVLDRGGSQGLITSWLRNGRLTAAWENVYAVGPMPKDPAARAWGATLAAGDHAALAAWSAAAFYAAVRQWRDPLELISPRRVRVRGLHVQQCSRLGSRDIWRFDGLRVTSPARTALDMAARITDTDRLRALVDHLRLRHNLTQGDLRDILARNVRHPGGALLRRVLGELTRGPTRSRLERVLWPRFAREHGIPAHEQNVTVAGVEVDVLIGDGLAIVELDTVGSHLLNFDSDRLRDAKLLARTGIPVIRITDTQMSEVPEQIAANILAVVNARAARLQTRAPDPGKARELKGGP